MQNFMALHAIAREIWPFKKFEKLAVLHPLLENEIRYRAEICFVLFTIKGPDSVQKINKSAAPERAQNGAKIYHLRPMGKVNNCSLFRSKAANNDSFLSVNSAQVSTPSG